MRKALDALYGAALVGACLAMIIIVVLVFAQVLGRVVDRIAVLFGFERFGFLVPSLAEIGGFLFVATAFLALPSTLRAAGHVRVTLLLRNLRPAADRAATVLILLTSVAMAAFASWSVTMQTLASYHRGSLSFGIIPVPLWVPQGIMTIGIVLFTVALLDELIAALRGGEARFRETERHREVAEGGH
jgi:TRAP-type C4-dicarboxylate transport system permease small subunit